ncbi:hypothetical protein D3C81_2253910 [compost metagenome]
MRAKVTVAETVAEAAWNLFVAIALIGSTPARNNAGKVIKPPPPAIASKKPAQKATSANMPITSKDIAFSLYGYWPVIT